MQALHEYPVRSLDDDTKRKSKYNALMQTYNDLTRRFKELAKRFQHDEQIKVDAIRTSLKKLQQHKV